MLNTLTIVILSSVISIISTGLYFNGKVTDISRAINERPATIIVDMPSLALEALPNNSSSEEIANYYSSIQRAVEYYRDQGYIVLSRQYVIESPDNMYLTIEEVNLHSGYKNEN